jgi:hypothetical protein
VRGAGRFIIPVLCPVVLLLAGCASDASFTMAGRTPNPKALEEDASDCRSVGPAMSGFFGGALLGAASGAQVGASSSTAGAGAAAGAVLGSLIGLVVGTADSVSGDGYDHCMQKKGYQIASTAAVPVDAGTPAPSEPVVFIRALSGEPAR